MRAHSLLCALGLVLLASCASTQQSPRSPQTPPPLAPLPPSSAPLACADFLPPAGDWQYVHDIRFTLARGGGGSALGVVVLAGDEIRCALTTVEGLTLFEARTSRKPPTDGAVHVSRALPPFDKPAFAENLFRDIRLLFLPPSRPARQGQGPDGSPVCRFRAEDGATLDLTASAPDGCRRTHSFHADPRKNRTVLACASTASDPAPVRLELTAPDYTLKLRLISAQPLESTP